MLPSPVCAIQQDLKARHRIATRVYIMAAASMDGLSDKEFKEAYEYAETVRLESERLRNELDRHEKEHGCG